MTSPKVSIIIPVYNCGNNDTIHNLIGDILNQTESDWELLLCNDGSTDDTAEICRCCAEQDNRIHLINCSHRGVSATRNAGIDHAKGKWITFVDADDKLTPVFLEGMLKKDSQPDIDLICGSFLITENSKATAHIYSENKFIGKTEIKDLFEYTDFLQRCSPWSRLFKKNIIAHHGVRFNEALSHSEDRLFIYNYLIHCNAIATSATIGYIYGSFSGTSLKHKRLNIETMITRQSCLTQGAIDVITRFNLNSKQTFAISNNLLHLLNDSLTQCAMQLKNKDKRIAQQKKLLNVGLTPEIIKSISDDFRIQKKIDSDKMLYYLVTKNLRKYNARLARATAILKFKLLVRQLFGLRNNISQFKDFIHYIN